MYMSYLKGIRADILSVGTYQKPYRDAAELILHIKDHISDKTFARLYTYFYKNLNYISLSPLIGYSSIEYESQEQRNDVEQVILSAWMATMAVTDVSRYDGCSSDDIRRMVSYATKLYAQGYITKALGRRRVNVPKDNGGYRVYHVRREIPTLIDILDEVMVQEDRGIREILDTAELNAILITLKTTKMTARQSEVMAGIISKALSEEYGDGVETPRGKPGSSSTMSRVRAIMRNQWADTIKPSL